MAKSYKGVNLNGDALMHYRTKGSRNGYSKNPNYRAVGQKATGRLVNGRYVYDNPYLSSYGKLQKAGVNEAVRSIDNGAKNNWQQQANETSATNRMLNEHIQKRTTTVNMPNNNTTHKAMQKHNIFTKGWDGAVDNSYANASARVAAGKRVSSPQRTQVASAKSKRDKAIAKGAKNNWQQAGNLTRSMTEVARDLNNRYNLEQKAKKSSGKKMTKQLTNFGSGQKATGKLVNGRYVYEKASASSDGHGTATKPANVSQEYWDNLQANTNPNYKPAEKKPNKGINTSIDPRYAVRSSQHGTPYVSEEYKQELAYNTGKSYTPKKNAINVNTDPRYKKQETNTGLKGDPRYSVAGTNKIDRAKITALAKKGAKNDWQQMAQIASRTGGDGQRRENTGASRSYRTLERVGSMSGRVKGDKAAYPVAGIYDTKTGKTKSYTHNIDGGYDRAVKKIEQKKYQNSESAKKMQQNLPSAMKMTASGYKPYQNGMAHPAYSVVGSTNMRIAQKTAQQKALSKTAAERKAEQKRIEAGKKAREKRNSKKQSLISKIKGLFSKKK